MDEYAYVLYAMLLANMKMNYQIMSALVRHDNPILKEWKDCIDQTEVGLQDLKQQLGSTPCDFEKIVDEQPTVYDIDKVVEELEDCKSQYEKISLSINDEVERRIYIAKDATMYNAIEIVKQGVRYDKQ